MRVCTNRSDFVLATGRYIVCVIFCWRQAETITSCLADSSPSGSIVAHPSTFHFHLTSTSSHTMRIKTTTTITNPSLRLLELDQYQYYNIENFRPLPIVIVDMVFQSRSDCESNCRHSHISVTSTRSVAPGASKPRYHFFPSFPHKTLPFPLPMHGIWYWQSPDRISPAFSVSPRHRNN